MVFHLLDPLFRSASKSASYGCEYRAAGCYELMSIRNEYLEDVGGRKGVELKVFDVLNDIEF